ncbi:unnamed protein product [Bathycoccus prasinos]
MRASSTLCCSTSSVGRKERVQLPRASPSRRLSAARCERHHKTRICASSSSSSSSASAYDYIVVGSGIGGLTAAAMLSYHGNSVLVLESHYETGGAAHGFTRRVKKKREEIDTSQKSKKGDENESKDDDDDDTNESLEFVFDTGPSFFAGLTTPNALNPLASVLEVLGEPLETVKYDPLGTFHIEKGVPGLRRHADLDLLCEEIERFSEGGAKEVRLAVPKIRDMFEALSGLPTIALRTDWRILLVIGKRYLEKMSKLGKYGGVLGQPTNALLDFLDVRDPWVKYLCDLECFLLSGMDASGTVSAEFASVFGASDYFKKSEFPVGGGKAISDALVRAIEKRGGEIRVNAHVIEVALNDKKDEAIGVRMRMDPEVVIKAKKGVLSNASVWDTYEKLLPKDVKISAQEYQKNTTIDCSDSFMHIHLGIKADGLDFSHLGGHHVVVNDKSKPLDAPGNVCMISIATVWSPEMAPDGHHCVHCYTMEPYDGWTELKASDRKAYEEKKKEKCDVLFKALETVIPDVRSRVVLELLASPASHEKWLRRYRGTYGAVIPAPKMFPGPAVKGVKNLYRVGDSVAPGVGVPAAAGSGVICANTLTSLEDHFKFLDKCDEK